MTKMGMGTLSRRDFLNVFAGAGASFTLEKLVHGHSAPVPLEFLATLNALSMLQDKREKMPEDSKIKDAEKEVRNLFKEEYKTRKPEFADVLLKAASEQTGAVRYVVLKDSMLIGSDNFKLSTAFSAVEKMAESYQMKLDSLVSDVLKNAKKGIKSPDQIVEFAEFGLKLTDLGMKWNDYDMAIRSATDAKSALAKSSDKSAFDRADGKLKEANLVKKEYDDFTKAELNLASIKVEDTVNDAGKKTDWEKNSIVVGKWYCFKEDKWTVGIYALRSGSDKDLAEIAKKEIDIMEKKDKQFTAENFYDVAEAWYSKAQKESNARDKGRYNSRALFWYDKSLETATGLLKAKVEKRTSELRTTSGKNIVDLLKMIDPQKDAVKGQWKNSNGTLVTPAEEFARLQIPYEPPESYELTVIAERKGKPESINVGLVVGGRQIVLTLDGNNGKRTWMDRIDGGAVGKEYDGSIFQENKQSTLLFKIRKNVLNVSVDGKEIMSWDGDPQRFSIHEKWRVPNEKNLFIGANSNYNIYKITLTQTSGSGKYSQR